MGEPPLNVLRSAELKRRGIAAVEEVLRPGPVHLIKRNRPASAGRSRDAIDADLNEQRNW